MINRVLEDACKNDLELRAVLGDSIGNPELMRKKVLFSFSSFFFSLLILDYGASSFFAYVITCLFYSTCW